ncbi:MAG: hypothetical protein ACE5JX_05050 [Acidobacteriota bacterium]
MKKSTLIIVGSMVLVLVGAFLLLRVYQLPLIHIIVENAVIQKAPRDYPRSKIHRFFERGLERAQARGQEAAYLRELLVLSQRLEKIQRLSGEELDALLASREVGRKKGPEQQVP